MSTRELHWRIGERDVACRIEASADGGTFVIDGKRIPFRVVDASHVEISGKRHRFFVAHQRDSSTVWIDGRTYTVRRAARTGSVESSAHSAASGEIRALMPGKVLRLNVSVGEMVAEKQTVATMESMKMESPLLAPRAGRVSEIRFKAGEVVDMGEVVVVIEGDGGNPSRHS